MTAPKPTREQFAAFERMFAHFNARLFGRSLPACMLNFSRAAKSSGFFAPSRWEELQGKARAAHHEISLNPSTLKFRKPIEVASTLVHEMVHLWQEENGKPSRAGYHNEEWAKKMEEVGLAPSSTGEPGGARVGQKMTHYIVKGGAFEVAYKALPSDAAFPFTCGEPTKEKKKKAAKNKVKYTCEGCGANVWGKPDLSIRCVECKEDFTTDGE